MAEALWTSSARRGLVGPLWWTLLVPRSQFSSLSGSAPCPTGYLPPGSRRWSPPHHADSSEVCFLLPHILLWSTLQTKSMSLTSATPPTKVCPSSLHPELALLPSVSSAQYPHALLFGLGGYQDMDCDLPILPLDFLSFPGLDLTP